MKGGFLSLLYSVSDKSLEYWSKEKTRTGHIRRVIDEELNEKVLEIQDVEESNYQKTWIMCPPNTQQILNIKLPFLVIMLKNLHKSCFFQLQLVDKDGGRHLVNYSNVEPKKNPNIKSIPPRMHLLLYPGWNRLEIDLNHLSKLFDAQFEAVSRIKICANCRIRRIYFLDRHYDDDQMSPLLYQGFLDMYMMKWGIKNVERATQTKKTSGKLLSIKENPLRPSYGFNKLFLKNLQAKTDKIIEEFFSKQSVKSIKDYLDFKPRAKIKPYAIPEGNRLNVKSKGSDSSLIDIKELRRSFAQENYPIKKIPVEEKTVKVEKKQESKDEKGTDSKYSMYKTYRYKLPEVPERKPSIIKHETLLKYRYLARPKPQAK